MTSPFAMVFFYSDSIVPFSRISVNPRKKLLTARGGYDIVAYRFGAIVQLASTLHWQCRGQGFKSP